MSRMAKAAKGRQSCVQTMSVWINMRRFWRVTAPRRPLPTVLGYFVASGSIGFSSDSTQSNANLDGVEDQPGMRVRFVRISINWSKDGKTLLTNHCLLKILIVI
jgi:hypothetical protein